MLNKVNPLSAISAGSTLASRGTVAFSNSNGVSFGLSGNTLTASVQPGGVGLSAGTQSVNTGTVVFANSNGFTFGMSGSSQITGSYTVPGATVFSNSNNVSFGLNGSTVTATVTVPAQTNQTGGIYASSNTFSSTSGTYDARSLSIAGSGIVSVAASNSGWIINASVAAQTVQTQNLHDLTIAGNSTSAGAGYILVSSGTLTLAGGNNITLSQNGNAVTISGPNVGGAQTGISGIVVSNTTYTSGTVSFSNANGISFGSSAGQAITASYTVPATAGLISGLNVSGGAGNSQSNVSGLTFANSNGLTFGVSTGANVVTVTASYTVPSVPAQSNQTGNVYASSNTFGTSSGTYDARSLSIAGSGAVSVAASNSGWIISSPTQSVQTQNCVDVSLSGNSTSAGAGYILVSSGTLILAGGNNITLSQNGNSVTVSAANAGGAQTGISSIAAAGGTQTAAMVSFANSNGVTFGMSTGAVTGTMTASVAAQTNQTGGVYASSNTFGTSSGTYDARSLSIAGSGAVNVAASNSGWVISAPAQSVQTQNCVDVTLAGNSTSAGGGYALISSGTLTLAGGNNITLSQNGNAVTVSAANAVAQTNQTGNVYASSNTFGTSSGTYDARSLSIAGSGIVSVAASNSGWIINATVPAQTNQTGGVYASSNTFGTSSGTYDARSISMAGGGAASVAASNSGWVVSVPNTSSLSATGWASISTNGNTISVGASFTGNVYAAGNTFGTSSGTCDPRTLSLSGISGIQVAASNSGWVIGNQAVSVYEPFPILTGTSFSSHAPASWWFNRFVLTDPVALSNINVVKSLSPGVPLAMTLLSSGTLAYSYTHGVTVFSRQNYGTGLTNLTTVTTASMGLTATLSYATSSVSAAYSYVTNTTGGTTSFSTTTTGGNWSNYFSGPMIFQIPCVTTLVDGEYFIAHQHGSTASTNGSAITLLSISNLHIAPQVVNVGVLQSSGTQASLNPWGMGAGIASAVTTNATMAGSVISGATQNNWYFAGSNA